MAATGPRHGPHDALVAAAQQLQGICLGNGVTVGAAESCTGGLIAHALTSVAGSSAYFVGSVVSYANGVKIGTLGVPESVLAAHGAVSAQVARAMATGARERLGADLAVAVTGIAGPAGGTESKPVGLTYLAVADRRGVEVRRCLWTGTREANIEASAAAAIAWLIERADDLRPDLDASQ